MPIKLACFDIDDTILSGHLHRSLERAGVPKGSADEQTVRAHIEAIGGIKNRMALLATMRDLLKKDVKIAITSYTGYSESIPTILKMVGLNDNEIARIEMASFTPPKGPNGEKTVGYGKNHHIEQAIEKFGGKIKPQEVLLIDDRVDHFALAKLKGYNVVWVQGSENDVGYLNEVRELAGLSTFHVLKPQAAIQPQTAEPRQSWVDKVLGMFGLQRIPSLER